MIGGRGCLNGPRLDGHVPHGEMLALEVDSFIGKRLLQDLQRLAQPRRTLGEGAPRQTDPVVFVLDRTATDPQLKSAARDLVERGGHLGEDDRVPKLIAQHHMPDLDALGLAEQGGGQGPGLHRRIVGHSWPVQVVVEPERVDPEFVTALRAVQDLGVGEAHLRQVDADLGLGQGLSSNLPWVMVATPLLVASNANEFASMP